MTAPTSDEAETTVKAPTKLQMLWPERELRNPPEAAVPPGFLLRQFREADLPDYLELMHVAGFTYWTEETLERFLPRVVPGGFNVIQHEESAKLAATSMATHNPEPLHPFGGELGWVAGDPAFAGRGLGAATCAATTSCFLRAGYRRIYLKTDDWRLPAIRVYFRLGFEPFLYLPGMVARWQEVHRALGLKCVPSDWPTASDR